MMQPRQLEAAMVTNAPAGFWRALWLLNRLQALRFIRQLGGSLRAPGAYSETADSRAQISKFSNIHSNFS